MFIESKYRIFECCNKEKNHYYGLDHVHIYPLTNSLVPENIKQLVTNRTTCNAVAIASNGFNLAIVPVELFDGEEYDHLFDYGNGDLHTAIRWDILKQAMIDCRSDLWCHIAILEKSVQWLTNKVFTNYKPITPPNLFNVLPTNRLVNGHRMAIDSYKIDMVSRAINYKTRSEIMPIVLSNTEDYEYSPILVEPFYNTGDIFPPYGLIMPLDKKKLK